MRLYLQFGHGMMAHCDELLGRWGDGGVIISPRDLQQGQIIRVAQNANGHGCDALLDPQCYVRDADHHRLTSHSFLEPIAAHATGAFTGGTGTDDLLSEIAAISNQAGIVRHILPGCVADPVDEDWFAMQEVMIDRAPSHFDDHPLLLTVALSADAVRDEAQVEAIVERARRWKVGGFYVVAESQESYLVSDPIWLANLMLLVSGLKLIGKEVIVGYCNHQSLCMASANVNAIAAGTWLNVRSFGREKFFDQEDSVSRRRTWYYCPQALSEYTVQFLDVSQRMGILDEKRSDPALGSDYADILFSGPQPTTVAWTEREAFRHYLTCLRGQALGSQRGSFDDTLAAHLKQLDEAERLLDRFEDAGVLAGRRGFRDALDANRSALAQFRVARGARLRHSW